MLLYSNDHAGEYPDSLATVAATEDISATIFICPVSGKSPSPAEMPQALADDLRHSTEHSSYLYLSAGLTSPIAPDVVLACEPVEAHDGRGMNILLGDGHVEWITSKQAQPIFDQLTAGQRPLHYRATRPATLPQAPAPTSAPFSSTGR
jgi:prepilin-type processing-associated H-X9-DG protein